MTLAILPPEPTGPARESVAAAVRFDEAFRSLREKVALLLAPAPGAKRVLIVDDRTDFVDVAVTTLRRGLGPRVEVVGETDAQRALLLAVSEPWDAAIVDLHLGDPDVDGLDIVRELPRRTHVALISGQMPGQIREIAHRAHADAGLAKPLDARTLIKVAEDLLAPPPSRLTPEPGARMAPVTVPCTEGPADARPLPRPPVPSPIAPDAPHGAAPLAETPAETIGGRAADGDPL